MPSEKLRFECKQCRTTTLFYKPKVRHFLHLILAVLTGGLWLISYIAIVIGHPFRFWTCAACGHLQQAPGTGYTMGNDWRKTGRGMDRIFPFLPGVREDVSEI